MENNFDREVNNPDNYKFVIFYFNPSDKRIIVPKRNRFFGWTINFGLPGTYLLIIMVVAIIVISRYLLHNN